MKRYYLSKIKQVYDPDLGAHVWRHRIQEYNDVDYLGGEIKVDPVTGIPTEKALLVLVASQHHKAFVDDPELVQVPVGQDGLAVQVGATDTPTKLKFRKALQDDLGLAKVEIDSATDNPQSWKQVVDFYGKKNNAAFDADDFDMTEG